VNVPAYARRYLPVDIEEEMLTAKRQQAERALNVKLAELTLLLARLEDGVPMLLQAWAPFAEGKVQSCHGQGVRGLRRGRTVQNRPRPGARSLGERNGGVQTVNRRGEPEGVVPECAVAGGIDLVVMGTVARSGVVGLLMGNTAERVLRNLPCSVLAVKPDGFVSPASPLRCRAAGYAGGAGADLPRHKRRQRRRVCHQRGLRF